jgi:hypothetical protein
MGKLTTKQALYEQKSLYVIVLYLMLTFYYFGIAIMTRMVIYPSFEKVHENYQNYIQIFSGLTRTLQAYSPILLLLSTIALLWFRPKVFPRWAVIISIVINFVLILVYPNLVGPIFSDYLNKNYNESAFQNLMNLNLYFQIIPACIQVLLAFWLLNNYLKDTKLFSRWTFIILFSFAFFTGGTGAIEGLVNYNLWFSVGENDWLPFRNTGTALSFWVTFLIPAYLPIFALIAMFWKRPKAIPLKFITIYALTYVWIVFITAYYFIPDIQLVLNKHYSPQVFQDLLKYDGLLRGLPSLPMVVLPIWMFIRIGQEKINENIEA